MEAKVEAEKAAIGCVLAHSDRALPALMRQKISQAHFKMAKHRLIWSYCEKMFLSGTPIDLVTFPDFVTQNGGSLKHMGGEDYLMECMDEAPTTAHIKHYAEILRNWKTRSDLIDQAKNILEQADEEGTNVKQLLQESQANIVNIGDQEIEETSPEEKLAELRQKYDQAKEQGIVGIPTGYRELDKYTSGIRPGRGMIYGAPPKEGKTTFALGVADHNLQLGNRVGVFSQEMSDLELREIICAKRLGYSTFKFANAHFTNEQRDNMLEEFNRLSQEPLHVYDRPGTVEDFVAWAYYMKSIGTKILIIDYIQILLPSVGPAGRTRENMVTHMSNTIRATCKRLELPYLMLSQFSTKYRKDGREPGAQDLRESGAIEQDAYSIVLGFRDPNADPTQIGNNSMEWPMIWKLCANRGGPTGRLKSLFRRNRHVFTDPPVEAYYDES